MSNKDSLMVGSISVADLKKQRLAMVQTASAFIAEYLPKAIAAGEAVVAEEDPDLANALAAEAIDLFESVNVVAGAAGVEYYIPFQEDGYGDSMASDIENAHGDRTWDDGAIETLHSLLEDMEYQSRQWNSSTC